MRTARLIPMALVVALALVGCGGGGGDEASAPADAASSSAPTAAPSESEPSTPSMFTLTAPVNASTTGYTEKQATVAADTPFMIHFDNQDVGIPHNVEIFEGAETTTGTPVWTPGAAVFITGPDSIDYDVPALGAGTYTFACSIHLAAMSGTLTVE